MNLQNTEWELVEIMGVDVTRGVFKSELPSLTFGENGSLSGYTGCNNFSGSYELTGDQLTLNPGAMTRKACPGDGEQRVLNGLNGVSGYNIHEEQLILKNSMGTLLLFTKK